MVKTISVAAAFLIVFAAGEAVAQNQRLSLSAAEPARATKALSAEETRDLLEGRGMGLAKAAEFNRHPGPMHVLELAGRLGLSDSDAAAVRKVFEAMRIEARALGRDIVAAEGELDRLFAHGPADAAAIDALTAKISALRGRLRAVHLKAHLAIRPMLAADTVARYDALRGYSNEPAGGQSPKTGAHRH